MAEMTYTKRDIQSLIDWLDENARLVSNLKKPRSDNSFGRAAQALADLIEPWAGLVPVEQFTLTVRRGGAGLWYITGSMHEGLLVTGRHLGDALAKVPGAWSELLAAAEDETKRSGE